MSEQVCNNVKGWSFSNEDLQANNIFEQILKNTRKQAPQQIYMSHSLIHLQWMKNTQLYKLMSNIPKSTMHHLHLDCCEDKIFYKQHILTDPNIYVSKDHKKIYYGTKQQAQQEQWKSIQKLRSQINDQNILIDIISNITMLNKQQISIYAGKQKSCWGIFEQKINNFFNIYFVQSIFRKYLQHLMIKFIKNGYDRIQFRALLIKIKSYNNKGQFIKQQNQKYFMNIVDQIYQKIHLKYNNFTIGFIFFGLKVLSSQQNQQIFTTICQLNWNKTIGVDFVQQQDIFDNLHQYDKIINKVFQKYPKCNYKKVYHAGQTNNHLTNNIQIAVKAGSVRIGHGFNILQRIQFLSSCKNICFQKNPMSNLILGYKNDSRTASAPILLGLGYAVTINPDDPGKFGIDDTTVDYFVSVLSFNWNLKHLKLLALHSINHAICSQEIRNKLLLKFNESWNQWIADFRSEYKSSVIKL